MGILRIAEAAVTDIKPKLRCAIYTRKSHEEGLEQEYNSLDAQYDAAASYIQSQRQEGWALVSERYDDGGFSGGTLERPALKRLIEDIELGRVDVIVVYKIDRLSRSLLDFTKLVKIFDDHGVTFVSVTQHFNTTTSMGRLTLNILLSFAQFEREVTGERIRDKFAASKKKGIWMGGTPPLGYDVKNRKLLINQREAKVVRFIFEQFARHGSKVQLVEDLEARCYRGKSWVTQTGNQRTGNKLKVAAVLKILTNPMYLGKITHKGQCYDGEHEPIIDQKMWDAAHLIFESRRSKQPLTTVRSITPYLLRGIIFDQHGWAMTAHYTGKRKGRKYRYYTSTKAIKEGYSSTDLRSIPAEEIETMVLGHLRQFFTVPEIVHRVHLKAQQEDPKISADEVRERLGRFHEIWDQLFPLEQTRIIKLIVRRIQVSPQGVDITYQPNGIMELYAQIPGRRVAL